MGLKVTTEPDKSQDNPELSADQCRICYTTCGPSTGSFPFIHLYCREPVVNTHWQICERHEADRLRMIEADKKRGLIYG